MDAVRDKLSANLLPYLARELDEGNVVVRVDEPAGTLCPLAIVFKQPLNRLPIEDTQSNCIKWWECHDPHYPIESGYRCTESKHVLAGPLGS